jgi:hypothetical protein
MPGVPTGPGGACQAHGRRLREAIRQARRVRRSAGQWLACARSSVGWHLRPCVLAERAGYPAGFAGLIGGCMAIRCRAARRPPIRDISWTMPKTRPSRIGGCSAARRPPPICRWLRSRGPPRTRRRQACRGLPRTRRRRSRLCGPAPAEPHRPSPARSASPEPDRPPSTCCTRTRSVRMRTGPAPSPSSGYCRRSSSGRGSR